MKIICGIYCWTNTHNGKRYIGQSVNITRRKWSHTGSLLSGKHRNRYLQRVVDKHSMNALRHEVLEIVPESLLNERERFWIEFYQTNNSSNGYNLDNGGKTGSRKSLETIHKMKIAKGNMSEETKSKMRKPKSPEHVFNISEGLRKLPRFKKCCFCGKTYEPPGKSRGRSRCCSKECAYMYVSKCLRKERVKDPRKKNRIGKFSGNMALTGLYNKEDPRADIVLMRHEIELS